MSDALEVPPWSAVDDAVRYTAAQLKARRLWPGPVGEAVSAQLDGGWHLRAVLGSGSLTERLLVAIEATPEPGADR